MNAPIPSRPLLPLKPGETGEDDLFNWSGQLAPHFQPVVAAVEPIEALQARVHANQVASALLAGREPPEPPSSGKIRAVDPTVTGVPAAKTSGGAPGWS
jgi:hypothetical protein